LGEGEDSVTGVGGETEAGEREFDDSAERWRIGNSETARRTRWWRDGGIGGI
jgi:hypothetical protein